MTKDLPIYNPAHPHFASWRACIDSLHDKGVPLEVQSRQGVNSTWWVAMPTDENGMPAVNWCAAGSQYRIKPPERKMITRTLTYPEPMKEAPAVGSEYWIVLRSQIYRCIWDGFTFEGDYIENGFCYDNEADAQARWDVEYGGVK